IQVLCANDHFVRLVLYLRSLPMQELKGPGDHARKDAREEAFHVDHVLFAAATHIDFLLMAGDAFQDFGCALLYGHALSLALVHLSVLAAITGEGMQANIGTDESWTCQRNDNSLSPLF